MIMGAYVKDNQKFVELNQGYIVLHIANGRRVKFGKDRWNGDSSLENLFLSLLSILNKDA